MTNKYKRTHVRSKVPLPMVGRGIVPLGSSTFPYEHTEALSNPMFHTVFRALPDPLWMVVPLLQNVVLNGVDVGNVPQGSPYSELGLGRKLVYQVMKARKETIRRIAQCMSVGMADVEEWNLQASQFPEDLVYTGFIFPAETLIPFKRVRYICRFCQLHAGRRDVMIDHGLWHLFGKLDDSSARDAATVLSEAERSAWLAIGRDGTNLYDDDREAPLSMQASIAEIRKYETAEELQYAQSLKRGVRPRADG